jgi:hypothetical protein
MNCINCGKPLRGNAKKYATIGGQSLQYCHENACFFAFVDNAGINGLLESVIPKEQLDRIRKVK